MLGTLKQSDAAIASYRRAIAIEPEHELARYALAALGQMDVPKIAPQLYVANLFDNFADKFDVHLQNALQYKIPSLLLRQFNQFCDRDNYDVLDLGCGTGLVGEAFKSIIRRIDGVDLSQNMLSKARQRNIYASLVCEDIVSYLNQQTRFYDLIVCADVLIYIGDLESLFIGVSNNVIAGGFFLFSLELSEHARYELKPSKRYGHSLTYIETLASQIKFEIKDVQKCTLRKEFGEDLPGHIVLMQKL